MELVGQSVGEGAEEVAGSRSRFEVEVLARKEASLVEGRRRRVAGRTGL